MKLILIGFMGSGKSTVGRAIAERVGAPFYEMDDLIIARSGRSSIPEIFDHDGEARFRTLESEVAAELGAVDRGVISTGGGVVGNAENLAHLRRGGGRICLLSASFSTVRSRLAGDRTRPLFQNESRARELFARRVPLYGAAADCVIDAEHGSPEEISRRIAAVEGCSGDMKVCLVIGDPIAHSLSPAMHGAGYRALGIDDRFVYAAERVGAAQLPDALQALRQRKVCALSCTMPLKELLIPLLDEVEPAARRIGAVNTVVNSAGRLKGFNTDRSGIVAPLAQITTLARKRAAVFGAGGAARAGVFGLAEQGAQVTVFNRTESKAHEIARASGATAGSLARPLAGGPFDIVVNATPAGMGALESECAVPAALLGAGTIVFETVYHPAETPLVREARAAGCRVVLGLEMLLHQGTAQFELFTGHPAPVEIMRRALHNRELCHG